MQGFGKVVIGFLIFSAMLAVFFGGGLYLLTTGADHLLAFFGALIISLVILFIYVMAGLNGKKTAILISICLVAGFSFAVPH